ncbi:hypothetical protein AOC36_00220 [Erysipelothrix larvae]|uniref:DNA 3'-5' helicase n=1 Tax=Erysipelothrix larvae TaxID=1514105 RepID=A0A0X8GXY3_9FIRM|nr:UvrD-helicase domain-containing protein [Erysipelothrix larvae]AMC92471.1 hypothetical protein AOC36_00220 [Erysipelothrix larvae]
MSPKFNTQQREAIEALGENVVVSASAGAGKTTVLIARLMKRILEDGVSIDRICALTFTDAAANEMKKRLLAALYEKNESDPSPYLTQQMMLVETSHISTIHSFCLSLIKDHGYLLGISDEMTQNILDPAMVTLYQKQAMDECIENWARLRRDDLKTLLKTFTARPQRLGPFFDAVMSVSKYFNSKHDKQESINFLLQTYDAKDFSALPDVIKTAYFAHHHLHLTLIKDNLQALIQSADGIDNQEELSHLLLSHYGSLKDLLHRIDNHDISFMNQVLDVLNIKIKTLRGQEEYKACGDRLAESIKTYIDTVEPISQSVKTLNEQAPILKLLVEFTIAYQERFQTIKKEIQGLDFDDFEHLAYSLLTYNDGVLSKELKLQFDEIMVDEFQDTNDFQDAIIQLISNGSNIFRVGDVKQSIYRFRGAKPSIMQSLMTDDHIKNIYLSFNYRSKEDIVQFNNDFFDEVLNLTSGMSYSDYDAVDTGIPSQKENTQPVEFLIVTDDVLYEPDPKYLPWDKDRNMRKARIIAQEVIRHHEMGYRFKDIVILIRGHAQKVFLKRAFEEVNIPHFIDDRGGFYNSTVVASILQFFKYVQDETDYSLANVLRSVFIGYSYDTLAQLKLHNPKSLYAGLKTFDKETFDLLQGIRHKWKHQDVVSCILDVINLNDAYHSRLSIQDKTNVDSLLEKAITYQSSNNPNLMGFMEFVNNLDDEKSAEAIPLSDSDDVVTAMTIHQSKGLQFPVVILWSMGRRVNRDLQGSITTDDLLGISLVDKVEPLNVARPSILKTLMRSKQDAEDLEETMRLVYVALTRPQERLVVVDLLKEYTEQLLTPSFLYSYKHLIELLVLPHSTHRRVAFETYNTIEYKILQPLETVDTPTQFVAPEIKRIETQEIDHGTFAFNPNFLEATAYGTTLHKAAEDLPQRTWTQEDLSGIEPKFHKALLGYNAHPFTQTLYEAHIKEQEIPFIYTDHDVIRNGIIDALYEFEDTIILVDYKTDNADFETLKQRYTSQLQVYKQALLKLEHSKSIQTYIYSFHNNDYLEIL